MNTLNYAYLIGNIEDTILYLLIDLLGCVDECLANEKKKILTIIAFQC